MWGEEARDVWIVRGSEDEDFKKMRVKLVEKVFVDIMYGTYLFL